MVLFSRQAVLIVSTSMLMSAHVDDYRAAACSDADRLAVGFYADVTRESCIDVVRALKQRDCERRARLSDDEDPRALDPIHLRVSSNGGSIFAGLHAYDRIRSLANVQTHVEGLVASAATLLTVAGSHRTMSPHSLMLVHQPRTLTSPSGERTASDISEESVNMQTCVDALVDVYKETTALTESEIRELIRGEQYMTARECLRYGFIDEIL